MDGVQCELFKSLIDNLFTRIRMEEVLAWHSWILQWGTLPQNTESALLHAFSKSAEFFQTGSNIEESTTRKLRCTSGPRIKSKNILIVEQISLSFYAMELQSGVFPRSIFSTEENGLKTKWFVPMERKQDT